MVLIPAGTFMMGDADAMSADAQPPHRVTLSAFCMDLTEVTVAAYRSCATCTTPTTGGSCSWGVSGRDANPIDCVDWYQARAYCRSVGGDLPTEAQWEYAARGSDTDHHVYPWGNASPSNQLCWSRYPSPGFTCAVQSFPAGNSPFGLFDMAGNVWEWTLDWYASYPSEASSNPTGPASGEARVFRGGGWYTPSVTDMRSATRKSFFPNVREGSVGFRCARGAN